MRLGLVLLSGLLLFSCGPSRPPLSERVQELPPEAAHGAFWELTGALKGKTPEQMLAVIQVWKQWLADTVIDPANPIPLRQGNQLTFVYVDATRLLTTVALEAQFSPAPLAMERWEQSPLFYRTFLIPKPENLQYRFVTGTDRVPLPDLLHADIMPGDEAWAHVPLSTEVRLQAIEAVLEPGLGGQDLRLLLPPGYDRDQSRTWPLLVLVGVSGNRWDSVIATALTNKTSEPWVVVSLVPRAGEPPATDLAARWSLASAWLLRHYRVNPLLADSVTFGWGAAARAVQDAAAARPELFGRVLTASPAFPDDPEVWDQTIAQVLTKAPPRVVP